MYIEVLRDAAFYWWRLKARNHEILATSEGYATLRNARKTAGKVAKTFELKVVDRTK